MRILFVEDNQMNRRVVAEMLRAGGVEMDEAEDGAIGLGMVEARDYDLILMDLRMPGMDGVEATRRIAAAGTARVLALTTFDVDEHVVDALRAGAVGFLLKDVTSEGLLDAVRRTAAGESVVAPAVLARMMDHFAARPPLPAPLPPGFDELSTREREVLALIGAGRSNAEIADALVISMATVKTHVRHLFAKLDLRDRAQAVVVARDAELRPDR